MSSCLKLTVCLLQHPLRVTIALLPVASDLIEVAAHGAVSDAALEGLRQALASAFSGPRGSGVLCGEGRGLGGQT